MVLSIAAVLMLFQITAAAAEEDEETVYGYCSVRLQACDEGGHNSKESTFGDFMTDAMCWYADADIGMLPSIDIGNHLQIGDVTDESLEFSLMRDTPLAAAYLSAGDIWNMMEISISHCELSGDQSIDWSVSEFDGFLQISGLKVLYNLTAPSGDRILTLETADGTELQPDDYDTYFYVVATQECFTGNYGYPEVSDYILLGTEREAAAEYISCLGTVSSPEISGRITFGGAKESFIANPRLVGAIIVVFGFFLFFTFMRAKRMSDR